MLLWPHNVFQKIFIFVFMYVCMHACASCLCEHVCTCVQACTQRSEGGIRSPLSLSIPLRQGLSLNLGLNFSWLGWKLASPCLCLSELGLQLMDAWLVM